MTRAGVCVGIAILAVLAVGCGQGDALPVKTSTSMDDLDHANPVLPLPLPPLGIPGDVATLDDPPTSDTVRLGRWLFYDPRLSLDNTLSCAACHRPENGFSEPTPVSTGIDGQKGGRKAPPVLNAAFTVEPHQFWDGRAATLEEQAIGPMTNPIEMGMPDHDLVLARLRDTATYKTFFATAFGDGEITLDRVARAISDYERTRFSGNSPWDRWQAEPDPEDAAIDVDAVTDFEGNINLDEIPFADGKYVTAQVKLGHYVFHDKAVCNQCHFGPTFSDSQFHNLGVGWNAETETLADEGRFVVTQEDVDHGAFKTPTLREATLRAPYMHDGSEATLRDVVDLYVRGGNANPWLSPKMPELDLTDNEIAALVAFLEALEGEGYQDTPPDLFPG